MAEAFVTRAELADAMTVIRKAYLAASLMVISKSTPPEEYDKLVEQFTEQDEALRRSIAAFRDVS